MWSEYKSFYVETNITFVKNIYFAWSVNTQNDQAMERTRRGCHVAFFNMFARYEMFWPYFNVCEFTTFHSMF